MIWTAVLWISWTCPGGLLGGFVPAAARPLLCAPAPRLELYDPARRGRAEARVRDLGAGAEIRACRGLRCSSNLADWTTDVKFKEAP